MNAQELKQYLETINVAGKAKAQLPGMIHQVWEDGEVTCQKCGDLLWQRTLHMFAGGIDKKLSLDIMPEQSEKHAYVFCESGAIADEVRTKIIEYLNL